MRGCTFVAHYPSSLLLQIIRHFKSLRTMQRDGGMIQMFLDEANNERMHLLTFVRMKDPGLALR